jgi:uncharacterized membrane protein YagU involved in acid resistance
MDLLWYCRYKRGGGESGPIEWEFSIGLDDWSNASTPGQVGKRLYEGYFQKELVPRWAALTEDVVHWAYGLDWGALYGIVTGGGRPPRIMSGLLFGSAVWLFGYVLLPPAKLYKPVWEYDAPILAKDYRAHLVYGVATAVAFRGRP